MLSPLIIRKISSSSPILDNILPQLDGNDDCSSITSCNSNISDLSIITQYQSDDEAYPEPIPANLHPVPDQPNIPGQPPLLDVKDSNQGGTSSLPLCLLLNARSLYNKREKYKSMFSVLSPDIALCSETWEREKFNLSQLIDSTQFKVTSYCRKQVNNKQPGGGCAIFWNETKFHVTPLDLSIPEGVEICWAMLTPKYFNKKFHRVKKICVASVYVAPKAISELKNMTVDHIIETIHLINSKEESVHFLIGGDLNRVDIAPILNSYGALKSMVSVPTRKSSTLEVILSDLHPFYHPPTTLDPLEVDSTSKGTDSDHNVVVMAPISNPLYEIKRPRRSISTRPLPQSQIQQFGDEIVHYNWENVLNISNANEKVGNFHSYIRSLLDTHFPEKNVKISDLDKPWMSPELKRIHRRMQREYIKNRKSPKWKILKKKFKTRKKKAVRTFHTDFINDIKQSNPSKWFKIAKKLGELPRIVMVRSKLNV